MTSAGFEIEIKRQGWIDPELEVAPADLCSHGDIRLEIGGQVIVSGEAEPGELADWWTISTSALALLRTLESDHSPDRRVADRLILHCGMIEMLTCPIGVDWSVTHLGGRVRLRDVARFDTVDETEAIRFPGLEVELAEDGYRLQVVAFAEKAKEPFVGTEKTPADDYERQLYEEFWREYDGRLSRARSPFAE
ncbi:MAG TPA: hypothetical protein VMS22_12495 [Candidatus Eisenbacteria bacterium]|nr:hypothetical protein [Candidatus Eisenbacteria bacterium]